MSDKNIWTAARVKQAINDHYTPVTDDEQQGMYECNRCGMKIYADHTEDEVPPPATVKNVVRHEESQCSHHNEAHEP